MAIDDLLEARSKLFAVVGIPVRDNGAEDFQIRVAIERISQDLDRDWAQLPVGAGGSQQRGLLMKKL